METDKLKRCPFCGGDNTDIISADIIAGTQYWRIHCYGCGCTQTPVSDKEEAIEAWNNRPSPWHTGTPTQNGLYLVCLIYCGDTYYLGMQFNDGVWDDSVYGFDWLKVDMLAWIPIEPYKEANNGTDN